MRAKLTDQGTLLLEIGRTHPQYAKLRGMLGAELSIRETYELAYDESKHPRGDDGRFISKGDIRSAMGDARKTAELRKRVTNPEQRKKLDAMLKVQKPSGKRTAAPKLKSIKAARAKASHKLVGKEIQRYAEEHNEPRFAKAMGGASFPDSEPVDVVVPNDKGIVAHGLEMKTLVANSNAKITMDTYAQVRKIQWEQENKATYHTVVFDDHAVFNAKGPGQHDESKRRILYRRGVAGSARIGNLHEVDGGIEGLKKLMAMPEAELPEKARRTDGKLREGKWEFFQDETGKGFRNKSTGQVARAKK